MQVNAILQSTDQSGKKINTTISYLRASQKSQAATLTQALNALTTNDYVDTQVNELNVDTAGKTEPTLTISQWQEGTGVMFAQVTYDGDGQLFVQCTQAAYIYQTSYTRLEVKSTGAFSGTIYATEGTNYAAKTLSFSH